MEILNWKLVQIKGQFEILSSDAASYRNQLIKELNLPEPIKLIGLDRTETTLAWNEMHEYHKFYFDYENSFEQVKTWLTESKLASSDKVIIFYGWEEPAIKVSTDLFISDWEGFLLSVKYETFIFSEDKMLIIEITRDYNMHSNFQIKTL